MIFYYERNTTPRISLAPAASTTDSGIAAGRTHRIARAIGDLLLARAEGSPQRCYSLSAQIQRKRRAYYGILARTQKGTLEVTEWLLWFFQMLDEAVRHAHILLDAVLIKVRFWQRQQGTTLNTRQIKVLNQWLDGFEGKLTTSQWAALAKCSSDTALRDIKALLERGVLQRSASRGRSTSYELKTDGATLTSIRR